LFSAEVSEDVKTYARNNVTKRLAYLETALGSKQFLMGDQFTVADAYLFVVLGWSAHVGLDIGQWPNLKSYVERIRARPHVVEAMTAESLTRKK
jgi:glutathione S-transferase